MACAVAAREPDPVIEIRGQPGSWRTSRTRAEAPPSGRASEPNLD